MNTCDKTSIDDEYRKVFKKCNRLQLFFKIFPLPALHPLPAFSPLPIIYGYIHFIAVTSAGFIIGKINKIAIAREKELLRLWPSFYTFITKSTPNLDCNRLQHEA